MPDWTYQPIFRPLVRLLGPKAGRALLLGGLGTVARLPGGRWFIEFLGHTQPAVELSFEKCGCRFPARVGIGCLVDGQLACPAALVRLGIGALEIGPIGFERAAAAEVVECDWAAQRIVVRHPLVRRSLGEVCHRVKATASAGVPIFLRLESLRGGRALVEQDRAIELAKFVAGCILPVDLERFDEAETAAVVDLLRERLRAALLLLALPHGAFDSHVGQAAARLARDGMIAGVLIEPPAEAGSVQSCAADLSPLLASLPEWRGACGPGALLIARGGILEPIDALRALKAGADLVLLDSGLVHCGPGLPKRINELLALDEQQRAAVATEHSPLAARSEATRATAQSWFWLMLLGLGLLLGGVLTLLVALSRVVLPYDEALTGLTRPQIAAVNPKLLDFMRHDRITLSGTMLAVGILYLALTICGVRRRMHWAWLTVVASAAAGYLSFFLFLGFGYFDPFHAFVTAVSFPLLLLGIYAPVSGRGIAAVPDLHNDWRWRLALWGQLLFVLHGALLIVAGITISYVGATTVFVPEDMEFLCTADGVLQAAQPTLVPLVAHDRASFGGMLVTCGLATLLPALWGFRRGQAWLWWALMSAGTIAYVATLAVHLAVGYTSLWHLLPVYGGLAALWLAGALSYAYLRRPPPRPL